MNRHSLYTCIQRSFNELPRCFSKKDLLSLVKKYTIRKYADSTIMSTFQSMKKTLNCELVEGYRGDYRKI